MSVYDKNGSIVSGGAVSANPLTWKRGAMSNGVIDIDSSYVSNCFSCVVKQKSSVTINGASNVALKATCFTKYSADSVIGEVSGTGSISTPDTACYFIITATKQNISSTDLESISIDGEHEIFSHAETLNSLNANYGFDKLETISESLLTLSNYPIIKSKQTGTYYGVPYSAVNLTEGYVGIDLSFYSYMSAVSNPRSIIYTDYYPSDKSRSSPYGIDCSSLTSNGLGMHDVMPTPVLSYYTDLFQHVTDPTDLRVGDILLYSGQSHAKSITHVERDKYGRIIFVGVNDAWIPNMRHRFYFWNQFRSGEIGFDLRRYIHVDEDIYDSPLDYVFPSDPSQALNFPDIMTNRGDRVLIKQGNDVLMQVINSTGYSSIEVYRDGTKIDTRSTVSDFTLSAPSVGKYEVRLVGTGKTSSCFFNIGSISISVSGNVVSFTSSGIDMYDVSAYKKLETFSDGVSIVNGDKQRVHFLNSSERSRGNATVEEIVSYASSENGRIRVKGYDEFGTIFAEYDYSN